MTGSGAVRSTNFVRKFCDAPSYAKPVGIGDVMEGGTVSEVVASNLPQFDARFVVSFFRARRTSSLNCDRSVGKVAGSRSR